MWNNGSIGKVTLRNLPLHPLKRDGHIRIIFPSTRVRGIKDWVNNFPLGVRLLVESNHFWMSITTLRKILVPQLLLIIRMFVQILVSFRCIISFKFRFQMWICRLDFHPLTRIGLWNTIREFITTKNIK